MRQLFTDATILRENGNAWETLSHQYLVIDGDTISFIGSDRPHGTFDYERSYARHLLLPGLYNLHTHSPMTLLRGLGSDLPLDRWLREAIFPVEDRMTADDICVGTQLALMEFLASGVVSFTDMYAFPRVTAEEVINAGMKASLNVPVLSFDPAEAYTNSTRAKDSLAFFEECHRMNGGNVLVDFAIHAEYTSHPHIVEAYAADCHRYGARMHLHLSETQSEHDACKARYGKTPTRYFYDLGVFENPVIAAHCVYVEPEDITLLAQAGATVVHNPTSNMKLASGFLPINELMGAGVNLTLGTDGAASNNNLNMLEEMHLAAILHKGYTKNPCAVSPVDVLQFATANGARAQGRAQEGNLAAGLRADIVAINLDAPHLMPAKDFPALLVYAAQASDVAMTMVNGRVLYERGEYKTIDAERVKFDLQKATNRLFGE